MQEDIDELRMLVGNQGVSRVAKDKKLAERHEAEFKVFSQWRDDGLIQYPDIGIGGHTEDIYRVWGRIL